MIHYPSDYSEAERYEESEKFKWKLIFRIHIHSGRGLTLPSCIISRNVPNDHNLRRFSLLVLPSKMKGYRWKLYMSKSKFCSTRCFVKCGGTATLQGVLNEFKRGLCGICCMKKYNRTSYFNILLFTIFFSMFATNYEVKIMIFKGEDSRTYWEDLFSSLDWSWLASIEQPNQANSWGSFFCPRPVLFQNFPTHCGFLLSRHIPREGMSSSHESKMLNWSSFSLCLYNDQRSQQYQKSQPSPSLSLRTFNHGFKFVGSHLFRYSFTSLNRRKVLVAGHVRMPRDQKFDVNALKLLVLSDKVDCCH